ncbi:MAG TPA: hypothetical protein VGC66_00155 [Pyrinomonadaceae bacterium]
MVARGRGRLVSASASGERVAIIRALKGARRIYALLSGRVHSNSFGFQTCTSGYLLNRRSRGGKELPNSF